MNQLEINLSKSLEQHPCRQSTFAWLNNHTRNEILNMNEFDFDDYGRCNFSTDTDVLTDDFADLDEIREILIESAIGVLPQATLKHWNCTLKDDCLLIIFYAAQEHDDKGVSCNNNRLLIPLLANNDYSLSVDGRKLSKLESGKIIAFDEWKRHRVDFNGDVQNFNYPNIYITIPDPFHLPQDLQG